MLHSVETSLEAQIAAIMADNLSPEFQKFSSGFRVDAVRCFSLSCYVDVLAAKLG